MRAGPLSNEKVIDLLNRYFVPVYTVNEDYSPRGLAPKEEKAERNRIFHAGHAAKKSVGTVHVYVLGPNGDFLDSMHVAEAAKPKKLIALLERTVADLKLSPGQPLVTPRPQSEPAACDEGALTLHLVARSLDGRGAWSEFPVENWITLSPEDQRELIGKKSVIKAGDTWMIPPATAKKILTHFYPATENNDVSKNKFLQQELTATVLSVDDGVARARLEGTFRMEHWFYHKPDGKIVDAAVIGFMDFPVTEPRVSGFHLITEKATYGGGNFAIAVQDSSKN